MKKKKYILEAQQMLNGKIHKFEFDDKEEAEMKRYELLNWNWAWAEVREE